MGYRYEVGAVVGELDLELTLTFMVPDLDRKYEMAITRQVKHNKGDTKRSVESVRALDGKEIDGAFKIVLPRHK